MIEVRRYLNAHEGDLAKSLLESCGIQALVAPDNQGGLAPHMSYVTGVRLLVRPEDHEAALKLLNQDVGTPIPVRVLSLPAHRVDTAYKTAIVGIIVVPVVAHLLSLWHLLHVLPHWGGLSIRARRRAGIALAIDIAIIVCAIVVLRQRRPA